MIFVNCHQPHQSPGVHATIQKLIEDTRKLPDAKKFPLAKAQVVYRQTNMTKKYRADMVTFARSLMEKYAKYFVAYKIDLSTKTYEPILMIRLQTRTCQLDSVRYNALSMTNLSFFQR